MSTLCEFVKTCYFKDNHEMGSEMNIEQLNNFKSENLFSKYLFFVLTASVKKKTNLKTFSHDLLSFPLR